MDFDEFRNNLADELGERLYEQTGESFEFENTHVEKLQGAGYDGLVIRKEDSPIAINLDCGQYFKEYEQGKDFDEIAENALGTVIEGFKHTPEINVDDLMNYDVMKEHLAVQVVATDRNAEMLANIPHRNIEDMSMVCRFVVGENETGVGTILVNNQMLAQFGISEEQLFNDALTYAPDLRPSEIMGMQDVLAQMMGIDPADLAAELGAPDNVDISLPMYVASTKDRTNGAGIIAYPGFMETAAEKLGGDFYLLPSSVHEVILVPDKGDGDYHDLESMVREVNATQVEPADQLSDRVYHYDAKEKVFELAEKFEARKLAKEQVAGKESVLSDLSTKKKEAKEKDADKPKMPKAPGKGEVII